MKVSGDVLDVRLPDGTGARWTADGKKFIGSLGKYTRYRGKLIMKEWTADFVNNPYDDYNLIVEILYGDEEIAVIMNGQQGLEIRWLPNKERLIIPVDWLLGLLLEAQRRMGN